MPSQQNGPAGSEKQSENVNVDQGGFLPYGQKIELDQRTFSVHGLPIWSIASWKGFRTFKEFRYLCPKNRICGWYSPEYYLIKNSSHFAWEKSDYKVIIMPSAEPHPDVILGG